MSVPETSLLTKGLLLEEDEEEDEEFDEPLAEIPVLSVPSVAHTTATLEELENEPLTVISALFAEAHAAVSEDVWDISSWMIVLDEVESGRAGNLSFATTCETFLATYPRCAKVWQKLADFWRLKGDSKRAEDAFLAGATACWSVSLWQAYLSYLSHQYSVCSSSEQPNLLLKCEAAFELALEQIGLSLDSASIWSMYLQFVSAWAEYDPLERSNKISQLRKLYQRVISCPVDNHESFWSRYEAFEKDMGTNTQSDPTFLEMNKKYLHAKSIWRERRERVNGIVFDRISSPPTNSPSELNQLDLWNDWISFELSNPDYLNAAYFKPMMHMVFQQCLSCFFYNPEIWLAYASYEIQRSADQGIAARDVLSKGIRAIPSSAMLRVALAELEEQLGNIDSSRDVLRRMFEHFLDGYSFALYQRFLRRQLGVVAARRLFSETAEIRSRDSKVAIELYMAHASLELEVNAKPAIAHNVLSMALNKHPEALKNIFFVRLLAQVLVRIGDGDQMRLLFQAALNQLQHDATDENSVGGEKNLSQHANSLSQEKRLETELELLNEFLRSEIVLSQCELGHLTSLRTRRIAAKAQLDELSRVRLGTSNRDDGRGRKPVVFESAVQLIERYDVLSFHGMSETDEELNDRCSGRVALDRLSIRSSARDQGTVDSKNMSTDFHLSKAGLPPSMRELITKLPPLIGVETDLDGFIRHMKSIVLPPRPEPTEDEVIQAEVAVGGVKADCGDTLEEVDEHQDVFRKRMRVE